MEEETKTTGANRELAATKQKGIHLLKGAAKQGKEEWVTCVNACLDTIE